MLFTWVYRLVNFLAPSIGHVAFLTLTFADNVKDNKEASRRWKSFRTNFLDKHPELGSWILTKEVQVRGAWHYHILIITKEDIREGFDFDAYHEWLDGNNRFHSPCPTGNDYIRRLWSDFAPALTAHNFGMIFSLEPIASNAEAIGRYVGKYISKHLENRDPEHKGVRLLSCSQDFLGGSLKFAWHNMNSVLWRSKLELFAQHHGCTEFYQLTDKLGPNWAFLYAEEIRDIENILESNGGVCCPAHQDQTLARSSAARIRRETADRKSPNLIRKKSKSRKARESAKAHVGRILLEKPDLPDIPLPAANPDIDQDLHRAWLAKLDATTLPDLDQAVKPQPEGVPF